MVVLAILIYNINLKNDYYYKTFSVLYYLIIHKYVLIGMIFKMVVLIVSFSKAWFYQSDSMI